mmetsp:Transcript_25599/g.59062  ORF Transcript_25599/g.59062 Transcript_25599/m.59062 type:complete len:243 (-) Transcript_25599:504-1232(-)
MKAAIHRLYWFFVLASVIDCFHIVGPTRFGLSPSCVVQPRPHKFTSCTTKCSLYPSINRNESNSVIHGIDRIKELGLGSNLLKKLKKILGIFKKFIRKITEGSTVYVLECENGKYYVGSTTNKKQRFKQHLMKRGGSKWTKEHKPIKVLKEYTRIPSAYVLGQEAKVTAELMLKHGVNNVRGAMFAKPRMYTLEDLDALTGFLGHYNELSYKEIAFNLKKTLPLSSRFVSSEKGRKQIRKKN